MKSDLDIFIKVGLLINTVLLITERFLIEINDLIAIPIIVIGLAFVFIGFYRTSKVKISDNKE